MSEPRFVRALDGAPVEGRVQRCDRCFVIHADCPSCHGWGVIEWRPIAPFHVEVCPARALPTTANSPHTQPNQGPGGTDK